MKSIFLYLDLAVPSEDDLYLLRENNFIPIQVASFDNVKILETVGSDSKDIWESAICAIALDNDKSAYVRSMFAKNLFKRMNETIADN